MMRRAFCLAAALATCSSGCGGEVNLGGKSSDSWPGGDATKTVEGPHAVETELVLQFSGFASSQTLAVAGDYLYFTGFRNRNFSLELLRCRKTSCGATVEGLATFTKYVHSLQIYEQRLEVTAGDLYEDWLTSYALPSASDQRIVIDNLPSLGRPYPLFHGGFVYWFLIVDQAIYRCALPACAGGPSRIGTLSNDSWLYGDGDLIFWLEYGFVHRAAQLADLPAQRLLADQTLSEATADDVLDPSRDIAAVIATSQGMLYAGLQSTSPECEGNAFVSGPGNNNCVVSVVRWPVEGGARETIHSLAERVSRIFVFENELVWVSRSADVNRTREIERATLSSCRVEACAATRRDLGQVEAALSGVVRDEHHLYWIESAWDGIDLSPIQIRRVARLAAP
jgi:hypothetical protein